MRRKPSAANEIFGTLGHENLLEVLPFAQADKPTKSYVINQKAVREACRICVKKSAVATKRTFKRRSSGQG